MKKVYKLFIYLILIIILIILYARFIGPMGLITKEYPIYSKDLPNSFDGIKIVHFSDIHYKRNITKKKIDKIIKEINLIRPDIVVFTGDLIDEDTILNNKDINYLKETFKKINSKYGKYAIFGNHDYKDIDKIKDIYDNSDFIYLDNSYDIIYSNKNEKIFLGGISSITKKKNDIEPFKEVLKDNLDYKIFLIHEPDITNLLLNEYSINLILAGHSHNGQIRIPVLGAIYTPKYSKNYYDEYYKINNTDLYISGGIGVSKINYRLFNHPSINLYRLYKENSSE